MQSDPVTFASDYLELRTTTFGGRSFFAICDIKPGTRIHSSEAPFTHVVYRDYRREVCAQCFAYSASDQIPPIVGASRTWNVKWSREGAATAWFCNEACKEVWERDEASSFLIEVDATLTKSRTTTRKKFKSPQEEVNFKAVLPSFEAGDKSTNQAVIDQAWITVEALAMPRNPWSQFLALQKNELRSVQTRPYMLSAYLRIYVFLCNALPRYLQPYVDTVREVLARDTGNSFGIWDGDRRDEMMGWGIWVSASYFNHSCTPSVQKVRQGRVLHLETTREIQAGEELCISYINTDLPVDERRRELEESWFFICRCYRCEKDSLPQ
ncbi:hypothetical protein PAXINDRAFT_113456 [Paxillus involutus ATCC 200175]|nr:hypothetical protein PAXINDRAFT_113456 [Paxillus involutus ATCC 200175]